MSRRRDQIRRLSSAAANPLIPISLLFICTPIYFLTSLQMATFHEKLKQGNNSLHLLQKALVNIDSEIYLIQNKSRSQYEHEGNLPWLSQLTYPEEIMPPESSITLMSSLFKQSQRALNLGNVEKSIQLMVASKRLTLNLQDGLIENNRSSLLSLKSSQKIFNYLLLVLSLCLVYLIGSVLYQTKNISYTKKKLKVISEMAKNFKLAYEKATSTTRSQHEKLKTLEQENDLVEGRNAELKKLIEARDSEFSNLENLLKARDKLIAKIQEKNTELEHKYLTSEQPIEELGHSSKVNVEEFDPFNKLLLEKAQLLETLERNNEEKNITLESGILEYSYGKLREPPKEDVKVRNERETLSDSRVITIELIRKDEEIQQLQIERDSYKLASDHLKGQKTQLLKELRCIKQKFKASS